MKHQFYIMRQPKDPDEWEYIYHAKHPRFIAKIKQEVLEVVEVIDDVPPNAIKGKLKRMADWHHDYLMNLKKYEPEKFR